MIDRFALIIGAMRSGTTTLFNYLAQHPQICPCRSKEPGFFSRPQEFSKGSDGYCSLWAYNPKRHHIAVEASTSYSKVTKFHGTVQRIVSFGTDFRFVYIMRHPIERIESQMRRATLKNEPTTGTFEQPISPNFLDPSRYAKQLAPYYEAFPADRILLLHFDDLHQNPAGLLATLCRFLGVDDTHRFDMFDRPLNPSRADHPLVAVLERSALARRLALMVPARHKQTLRDRLARSVEGVAILTPQQRIYAEHELRDDMLRLNKDFGFDTSRWNMD